MTKRRTRAKGATGGEQPPINARARMERFLRQVAKLDLGDMTPEEAKAFIQEELTSGRLDELKPETPLEQAQELVYQAWEATGKRRQTLARRALELTPDCADAYLILADAVDSPEEMKELYEKAVEAGERAIGPEAFTEWEGEFWGMIETRPYMRARVALAGLLWISGETEQAVAHNAEVLRLNPNDNQGVRYMQIECLIELGRDREASALLNRYKDDASAGWVYARALLAFRKGGESHRSNRALGEALDINPFVPPYLLGLVTPTDEPPDVIGLGDEVEAIDYVLAAYRNWGETSGALEWLARRWGMMLMHDLREEYDNEFLSPGGGFVDDGDPAAEDDEG